MSTTSPFIKMTLQALDENPDTWGNILNVSALELLEDSVSGTAVVTLLGPGATAMNEDAGIDNDPHYRMMIVDIQGTPGGAAQVTVPPTSQIYVVANNTTGGDTITFKTTAGTGIDVVAATAGMLWCDGTNILEISVTNAATADLATDSLDAQLLDGLDSTVFAQLGINQTWTKGQVVESVSETVNGAGPWTLDIDVSDSNAFYHLTTENFTLTAPTGGVLGQRFSLIIEQGAPGGDTIAWAANTFQFVDGIAPTLSSALGDIDYLGFELYPSSAGDRWVGSILKTVSDV